MVEGSRASDFGSEQDGTSAFPLITHFVGWAGRDCPRQSL